MTHTFPTLSQALEQLGRHKEALVWAQAELACPVCLNMPSKCRSGRVLGRCHAALGQHALSVSALDAALLLAKDGEHLLSEALTVKARAMAGGIGNLARDYLGALTHEARWGEGSVLLPQVPWLTTPES